jgi:fucose permease
MEANCSAPDRPNAYPSGVARASKRRGRCCKYASYFILFVRHGWAIGAESLLLGLTIATIFPTVLTEAGSWFSAYSGTVFSILIGVALTGGITLPWVTGRLSQRAGIHTGLNLVILNAAGVWALQTLAGARMRLVRPFRR